jgi:predicted pyridoxine 5'-phosphate oxidase superfamily flavin-nucleotide-binding protein
MPISSPVTTVTTTTPPSLSQVQRNKDGDIEFKNNPADNSTVNLTQGGDGAHVGNIRVQQGNYTVNATQTGTTVKGYTVVLNCTSSCNKTVTVTQYD